MVILFLTIKEQIFICLNSLINLIIFTCQLKKISTFNYFNRSAFSMQGKMKLYYLYPTGIRTAALDYKRMQSYLQRFYLPFLFLGTNFMYMGNLFQNYLPLLRLFMVTYCDIFIRFNYRKVFLTMIILI